MNSRVGLVVAAVAGAFLSGSAALAQPTLQPTPRPIVTAENESWYLAGVPVTLGGVVYYPTGPQTHFNGNEMVRSGHFNGIPLYARTTIEPYSFVFVPVGGGMVHPYERRRAGDAADTVGSVTPSFPVTRSMEQSGMEYVPGAGMVQAQAPPTYMGATFDRIAIAEGAAPERSAAVGTTGTEPAVALGPITTARRPEGLNGVFIEFSSRRYFADGPAVPFDPATFSRVGEYRGFPVYQLRGQDKTLYLPPVGGATVLVTPYRTR